MACMVKWLSRLSTHTSSKRHRTHYREGKNKENGPTQTCSAAADRQFGAYQADGGGFGEPVEKVILGRAYGPSEIGLEGLAPMELGPLVCCGEQLVGEAYGLLLGACRTLR